MLTTWKVSASALTSDVVSRRAAHSGFVSPIAQRELARALVGSSERIRYVSRASSVNTRPSG